MLFETVKGYPNARLANNIYASAERIAHLFGVEEPKKFKFKAVEAIRQPLPPIEVRDAPCQEVVITKNLDVWPVVPMISHAKTDPGRTLGAGNRTQNPTDLLGSERMKAMVASFREAYDFVVIDTAPATPSCEASTSGAARTSATTG